MAEKGPKAMAIELRAATLDDIPLLQPFLSALGWKQRVQDRERLSKMLLEADRTVVAWDGGRIVGFARALCDGVSNGYISMVAVAEDRRREGIGRQMIERLMGGDPERKITWILRAGPGSREFWERLGFKPSAIAMERTREN